MGAADAGLARANPNPTVRNARAMVRVIARISERSLSIFYLRLLP
jgi:hypothetical protein